MAGYAVPDLLDGIDLQPGRLGQNFPGVADERLDDLWAKANAELDPEARLEIAKEIDKIIMGEAVTIPLAARPNQYAIVRRPRELRSLAVRVGHPARSSGERGLGQVSPVRTTHWAVPSGAAQCSFPGVASRESGIHTA